MAITMKYEMTIRRYNNPKAALHSEIWAVIPPNEKMNLSSEMDRMTLETIMEQVGLQTYRQAMEEAPTQEARDSLEIQERRAIMAFSEILEDEEIEGTLEELVMHPDELEAALNETFLLG